MIDTNALRSAVDSAARGPAAAAALCFGKIPRKLLTKALEAYAPKAASEEAIALVPSEGSGKSGFLLTDKALYFHATLGSFRYRFPYEDIVAVNKTNARLRIATATDTMEWNLASGDQLLWERSRQNAAEFVATVLATALQGDKPSIASGAPAQTPNPGPTVIIEHSVSTDFGRALAFHATVLVVGVPSLLLALFALFKFDPPYLYHISTALERFIHSGVPVAASRSFAQCGWARPCTLSEQA